MQQTYQITEHLFRHTYAEAWAILYRKFGRKQEALIEDAIQNAFYKALKIWSTKGLPDKPHLWIYRVALNDLLNQLKRQKYQPYEYAYLNLEEETYEQEAEDSQLRLLTVLCQANLSPVAQVIFSLRHLCAFNIKEVANALLLSEEAVYKSLQRSKKVFRQKSKDFLLASPPINKDVVSVMINVIYLLFNEGYHATEKEAILNKELCVEAIRLAHLLQKRLEEADERVASLLALMYFQIARFDTRIDTNGRFVSLAYQNRSQWNASLIDTGFYFLNKSRPYKLNRFYLEACIAAIHATSLSYKETDWQSIRKLYDSLYTMGCSYITAISRAIAISQAESIDEGLRELMKLQKVADHYYLYHVAVGDLLAKKEMWADAKGAYTKALQLVTAVSRQVIIQDKLQKLP